jgi:hypothetical protein
MMYSDPRNTKYTCSNLVVYKASKARLLQGYFTYTSQVIKKLLQRDDSRFFSHGVSWGLMNCSNFSIGLSVSQAAMCSV